MKLKTKLVIVFMVVMVFPMLFTGVMTRAFVPEKATEIQQMYLIVVSITAALLIIWIYRAVSVPLQKLQKAARNIKEGNLDFEIKAENADSASVEGLKSFYALQDEARRNGIQDMPLSEINEENSRVREEGRIE